MYKILDFTIVSGRADTLLLFCSDYQEAVTAAINKIMQRKRSVLAERANLLP